MKYIVQFCLVAVLCLAQTPVYAQNQQDCRAEFLEVVQGICGEFVSRSGKTTTDSAKLGVSAGLSGLLGRLVDIGGEASVGREAEYYENILQADLPKVMNQGAQCRLEVTKLLFDKICNPSAQQVAKPATPQGRTWLLSRIASDAPGCEITPVPLGGVAQRKIKLGRGYYLWTVNQNAENWRVLLMNGTYGDLKRTCFRFVGTFGPQVPWKELTQPAMLKPSLGYACTLFPKPADDGSPLMTWMTIQENTVFYSTPQQGNHWYVRLQDGKVGVTYAGCMEFLK